VSTHHTARWAKGGVHFALNFLSSFGWKCRRATVSINATGTHHIQPKVVTPRRTTPKKMQMSRELAAKHAPRVVQNVGRDQLARLMLKIAANGTSVPRIAACHFCGMPARSVMLAAAKVSKNTPTPIARSIQTSLFFIALHTVDRCRKHFSPSGPRPHSP
jgi:hypothetical protein